MDWDAARYQYLCALKDAMDAGAEIYAIPHRIKFIGWKEAK